MKLGWNVDQAHRPPAILSRHADWTDRISRHCVGVVHFLPQTRRSLANVQHSTTLRLLRFYPDSLLNSLHRTLPHARIHPREKVKDGPTQSVFDVFFSMVWGAAPTSPNTASTSRAPAFRDPLNPAPAAFARPAPKNYAYLPFDL